MGSDLSDAFEAKNGLRQGCTLSPRLFNIYSSAMVSCWRDECTEAGIDVMFTHGRKPVEDRTVKSRLGVVRVSETQFADDVALYSSSRNEFEMVTRKFVEVASKWGLTVSTQKIKGVVMGEEISDRDLGPVQVDGGEIEMVNCFTYVSGVQPIKRWKHHALG